VKPVQLLARKILATSFQTGPRVKPVAALRQTAGVLLTAFVDKSAFAKGGRQSLAVAQFKQGCWISITATL
jgi:hypothetical protein